ncbi:hypothetical protein [Cellulomonas edaphi]|uniref:DUF2628 domain-containing protein n=1 Tax=Cellulomonas edaphi TaxID=3053468 RepID=A0ABT7S285_9CELL|nr:hypothetical protein [Cellulomons edaphi]MDM7829722.1 hypothetical protein [Cellulomons edaphi]
MAQDLRTERPPLGVVAAYRVFGRRPAARYDGWLRDDLDSRAYPWAEAAWSLVIAAPLGVAMAVVLSLPVRLVVVAIALTYPVAVLQAFGGRASSRVRYFGADAEADHVGHFRPYRGMSED